MCALRIYGPKLDKVTGEKSGILKLIFLPNLLERLNEEEETTEASD